MRREDFINLVNSNAFDKVARYLISHYEGDIETPEEEAVAVDRVHRLNMGDGRPLFETYEVTFPDGGPTLTVTLSGTYSSYDSPYWHETYFSESYVHSETRYRKVASK